jgi:hypothetical protein
VSKNKATKRVSEVYYYYLVIYYLIENYAQYDVIEFVKKVFILIINSSTNWFVILRILVGKDQPDKPAYPRGKPQMGVVFLSLIDHPL